MEKTIKKHRLFNIYQYDLEEKYLREMHNQGYKFEKITFISQYNFAKCQPEDVIYKLDFPGEFKNEEEKQDYLQLYRDSGWEYIGDFFDYSYFRKPNDEKSIDIFSDDESKLEMIKKINKARSFPLLIIFLVALLPKAIDNITNIIKPDSFIEGFLDGFITAITIGYLAIFIYVYISYKALKKRIENQANLKNNS